MKKNSFWILPWLCLLICGCQTLSAERRIEEPVTANYTVSAAEFGNSMGNLLGAPLTDGNRVVELVNGDQIFPAMLEAIRAAQKSITLETFIWAPGQVSTQFVAALCDRARAGVKVHVLVDAMGSSKMEKSDVEQMTSAGVEYAEYNKPASFKFFRANHRTHRKIMVVDGRIGFTGGVCLADDWMGNAETNRWRDTHFRIEGPAVGQMQAVFLENWLQVHSKVAHGERYFPELKPAGGMKAQFFKSGPREGAENARVVYLLSIAAARQHIRLAHAQFVPNDLLINALLDARRRGVKIEVIVPAKSDNKLVYKASRSRWGELLEAGVEFYEYQPSLYHCKIMVVDDVWVTAGSINFDERSFRINDEANLNILDKDLAAKLIRSFEEDRGKSRVLKAEDFKERSWMKKMSEHFVGLFHSQL
jgi:cardiolipin synthase A/B